MSERLFDDLARLIGSGATRRRVLGGLTGSVFATAFRFGRQSAAATEACAGEGDACTDDANCCLGICCAGFCRDIECCIDEADPNARCAEGTSCFEGICTPVDGACGALGDPCDIANENADCCAGLACFEAICDNPSGLCMGADQFCGENELECCGGLSCVDGYCHGTCASEGEACAGDDDCCAGLTCADHAVCAAATELPSTGVGVSEGGWSPFPGAGLAAAAAAVYVGAKLRKNAEPLPCERSAR